MFDIPRIGYLFLLTPIGAEDTLGIYADVKAESVGKLSASSNKPTYSEYVGRFANFRLYRNQYRHNR